MVSDLRESGSIEQDADMVILLHREDMYNPDSERVGEADMIIAKHRGGQLVLSRWRLAVSTRASTIWRMRCLPSTNQLSTKRFSTTLQTL